MGTEKLPNRKISGPEQLGVLIRKARKEQGFTQRELSALTGVGPRLIGEIERGKPTAEIGKVFRLLASLGLDLAVQPRTTRNLRE